MRQFVGHRGLFSIGLAAGLLGASITFSLSASAARPSTDTRERSPAVRVYAGTEVPITVGASALVTLPYGLRAELGVGYVPGAYVDLMNAILTDAGAYNQDTADLIRSSISSSLSLTARAGWSPWSGHGLYFAAGYRLVALGGSTTGTELVEAATGQPLLRPPGQLDNLDSTMTMHMLDTQIGWSWGFGNGWMVRTAVGLSVTLAANATLEAPNTIIHTSLVDSFLGRGEDYLKDTATSYIHPPYVLLAFGREF